MEFDWDVANTGHLAKHRVEPAEAEQVFENAPLIRGHEIVDGEDRWTAVGITERLRVLVIVFSMRDELIRPITGWDADRQTKREFFAAKGT